MSYAMNRYWIPQWDIHKRVITQQLPYYLGPQATVRPYTLEVPPFRHPHVEGSMLMQPREKMVSSSQPQVHV